MTLEARLKQLERSFLVYDQSDTEFVFDGYNAEFDHIHIEINGKSIFELGEEDAKKLNEYLSLWLEKREVK